MHYMNKIFSNCRGFYSGINSTPNSGAVDVIVIEQPDGSFKSTPLRIVFGMMGVIKPRHQSIDVKVNNIPIRLDLRLGEFGEAYLAEEDSKCAITRRSLSTGTLDLLFLSELEMPVDEVRHHSSSESNCTLLDQQFALQSPTGDTELTEPKLISDPIDENECGTYLGPDINDQESSSADNMQAEWSFPGIQMSLCGDLDNSEGSLSRFKSCLVSHEEFVRSPSAVLANKRLVFLFDGRFYTWHSIGPLLVSLSVFGLPLTQSSLDSLNCYPLKSKRRRAFNWIFGGGREAKGGNKGTSDLNTSDSEPRSVTSDSEISSSCTHQRARPFERPNLLSSQQISEMNLNNGCNEASFSVTTAFQGTCTVTCRIFRWSYSDKLVVSDIDGTITKTDVLGHVLPFVGMNWCHDHVIKMCCAISNNEYRLIYLSSRSIAQSAITAQFIHKVRQDGFSLPSGPIMLSPYGFFQAFNREIILKCPQQFKISCLREVIQLFPPDNPSPIVGGFGNRNTDEITYRSIGLPSSRIFIIDPTSRVVIPNTVKLSTSYITVNDHVDAFFPFHDGLKSPKHKEYTSCNYWRLPFAKIQ